MELDGTEKVKNLILSIILCLLEHTKKEKKLKGKNMDSSENFDSKGGIKITKEMVKVKNMIKTEM